MGRGSLPIMSRFLCLLLFVQLSLQKDPLNDFCRRFGHQSAVVDNKLYLDGGFVNWNPISQNQQNFTNLYLLYNDLTSAASNGMPQLYSNGSKNASIPSVSGGILWPDSVNKRFYLWGGEYAGGITPDRPSLLSYDAIYDQWDSFGEPDMPLNAVSWGAGVGISDLGQGYQLGGWLSNNSVPGWTGDPFATSTLIKYQMDQQGGVWTNNTGPTGTGRAEGVMVYLPASGSGLLVHFGGVITPYGNSTTESSPMTLIWIYDIASGKWYSQNAGGDVPADRRRFCAGAAWAPDRSSYNIYLYGGLGFGANATGFDDVYILSLPSFTWIKWWEGSPPQKPHHSLTCNVVNGGQMLIIGGSFPLTDDCDSAPTWGTHNLDLGKSSGKMWNEYDVNITSYIVPPEVVAVVGGSSLGGATATQPAGGFGNQDLAVYFAEQASVATRTPTRSLPGTTNTTSPTSSASPHKKVLSTGAIVGIAVGGFFFLLALFIGGCCLIRRHRRNKVVPSTSPYSGGPGYPVSQMPQSPLHSPYSYTVARSPPYQLEADSAPQELSAVNDYQSSPLPQKAMMHQSTEQDHPNYWQQNDHSPMNISPMNISPMNLSPQTTVYSATTENNTNTMNTLHSHASSLPSYSNSGRNSRRTAPQNQTYYSP